MKVFIALAQSLYNLMPSRHLYQEAFVLIGVVCDQEARVARLQRKFENPAGAKLDQFMQRDEKDNKTHGQQVANATLKGQVQTSIENLWASYPQADRIAIAQNLLSTSCNLIKYSSLTDELKLDRWEKIMGLLSPHLSSTDSPSALAFNVKMEMSRGDVATNQRDYDLAISHYRSAIRLDPRHSSAYAGLGKANHAILTRRTPATGVSVSKPRPANLKLSFYFQGTNLQGDEQAVATGWQQRAGQDVINALTASFDDLVGAGMQRCRKPTRLRFGEAGSRLRTPHAIRRGR